MQVSSAVHSAVISDGGANSANGWSSCYSAVNSSSDSSDKRVNNCCGSASSPKAMPGKSEERKKQQKTLSKSEPVGHNAALTIAEPGAQAQLQTQTQTQTLTQLQLQTQTQLQVQPQTQLHVQLQSGGLPTSAAVALVPRGVSGSDSVGDSSVNSPTDNTETTSPLIESHTGCSATNSTTSMVDSNYETATAKIAELLAPGTPSLSVAEDVDDLLSTFTGMKIAGKRSFDSDRSTVEGSPIIAKRMDLQATPLKLYSSEVSSAEKSLPLPAPAFLTNRCDGVRLSSTSATERVTTAITAPNVVDLSKVKKLLVIRSASEGHETGDHQVIIF